MRPIQIKNKEGRTLLSVHGRKGENPFISSRSGWTTSYYDLSPAMAREMAAALLTAAAVTEPEAEAAT